MVAINAEHFVGVPVTANAQQVTLLEEERIMAYYGAGYLYAGEDREESLI